MTITVLLTSYNHEKYLRESIESVLQQTYTEFEFIIVDDCSTDDSWKIICEYKKKYPQIITIRHEYNWGSGIIADTVKNYATGEYIAVHHSDDIWDKNKLQKQVSALNRMSDCVAVFTNAQAIDDNGNSYHDKDGFYYNLFQTQNRSRQEWLHYFFYNGNCLCHPSILIRKDVYEEDGFFRKGLKQIPDFVKWIQICRKHEIYVLPEPLVKFRVHGEGKNTSGKRVDTQIRSTIELNLMLEEYLQITERKEFLKVFPEAVDYCKEDAFIPEFAFGKICTQEGMPAYTRLFGIRLLYDVLNNKEQSDVIKKNYNYTQKIFMGENGKYDVFKVIPPAFDQKASIYIDTGNGYNEDESYKIKYTLDIEQEFCWKFVFSISDKMHINKLRFDPAEGVMVSTKIQSILMNGIQMELIASNALISRQEDVFMNLDPIYEYKIPEELQQEKNFEIVVEGKVHRLDEEGIHQYVLEKESAYQKLEQEKIKIEEELKVKSEKLDKIENTKLYKMIQFFKAKRRK